MNSSIFVLTSLAVICAPIAVGADPIATFGVTTRTQQAQRYGKRAPRLKVKTMVATATVRGSGQAATMAKACTNAQIKVKASCKLRRGKVLSVGRCQMIATTRVGNQWESRQRATCRCRLR
jgi:hypothetical protein